MASRQWMNLPSYGLILALISGCMESVAAPVEPAPAGNVTGDLIVSNVTVGAPPYSSAYGIVIGPARRCWRRTIVFG